MAGTRLQDPGFATQIYAVTITVFIMNITTTWYLTGFICYRLWSSQRRNRATDDYGGYANPGPYSKMIMVLVESGMLYSVTEGIFLICIVAHSVSDA
ncbi:hypothetical protein FRB94_010908 [Tulasnella sp. JGI-2019a]|nr:hypothetical protein FRB94_010908 [Tulasnella sp. JGI-2019a]